MQPQQIQTPTQVPQQPIEAAAPTAAPLPTPVNYKPVLLTTILFGLTGALMPFAVFAAMFNDTADPTVMLVTEIMIGAFALAMLAHGIVGIVYARRKATSVARNLFRTNLIMLIGVLILVPLDMLAFSMNILRMGMVVSGILINGLPIAVLISFILSIGFIREQRRLKATQPVV